TSRNGPLPLINTGAQIRPMRSRSVGATYFGSVASTSTSGVASGMAVAAAAGSADGLPAIPGGSGAADQAPGGPSRAHTANRHNSGAATGRRGFATSGIEAATVRVYAHRHGVS